MLRFLTLTMASLMLMSLTGAASAAEAIAYRLSNWNEMHFDDPLKAEQHLAAVQKLGCEARQDAHDGHTDVIYRAAKWQALEVADDELAHQWEHWLRQAGFETLHGHTADHAGHDHAGHDHADHEHVGHQHGPGQVEEVAYRLPEWTTTPAANREQVPELVALLKGLGCEVQSIEQEGRAAVRVRCLPWKHIEVSSHQVAQGWEGWLQQAGFEVRHDH